MHRLSRSAAQRLQKPHTGYEAFVEPLAKLVEDYSASLGMEGIDVALMRASLQAVLQLRTQHTALAQQLALVDDSCLAAGATLWEQMLLIYSSARAAGRVNADIEAAIDPFLQFMKTGPHKSKPTTPVPTTNTGT